MEAFAMQVVVLCTGEIADLISGISIDLCIAFKHNKSFYIRFILP